MAATSTALVRSRERLQFHYDVERELAHRLKSASKAERKDLYTAVYDELFRRVQDHPQLLNKTSPEARARHVKRRASFLRKMMPANGVFLEIGPGDCALTLEMCRHAASAIAVDVSNEITRRQDLPANFRLAISDGASVPVESNSVDLAFSDQVMEHLHPDDAVDQLREVVRVLKPGGRYFCITPNRVTGPHDITRYFEEPVPQGLHLHEYGCAELIDLFRRAGLQDCGGLIGADALMLRTPAGLLVALEWLYERIPFSPRKRLRRIGAFRRLTNALLGIRLTGVKR